VGLANFLTFLTEKVNPTKFVFANKAIFIIASVATLINNTYILIIARFVMGLTLGLQFPLCNLILYESTPIDLRTSTANFISIFCSVGLMLGFMLSSMVNIQVIDWRTYYLIPIAIALFDFLLNVFYLSNQLSVVDMYSRGVSEYKIKSVLSYYMTDEAVSEKMRESSATHSLNFNLKRSIFSYLNTSKEQNTCIFEPLNQPILNQPKSGSTQHQTQNLMHKYKNEIRYGMKYAIILNLSLGHMITTYWLFMVTEDIENDSELESSNQILTIAAGVELIFKLLSTYYSWTSMRKKSLTIGMLILGILVASNGILQYYDLWAYCKYSAILVFVTIGVFLSVPYYSSLAELFPGPVIGVVHGFTALLNFGFDFLFPLLNVKADSNRNIHKWSYGFAAVIVLGSLLNKLLTVECSGLTRVEMNKKLKSQT